MRARIHDVVVIGAGPTGCYSAFGLAQKGYDVLVVEKDSLPRSTPVCTGVIGAEAFEDFDLPRESVLATVKDIALFSPGGRTIIHRPPSVQAYAVDRGAFDQSLQERAQKAGALFLGEARCRDIRILSDSVEIETIRSEKPIRARSVVLASGYNAALPAKVGLGRILDHFEGVQTEAEVSDLANTEIYVGRSLAPSSFGWMLPLNGNRARVGLTTRRDGMPFLERFLDHPPIRERVRAVGAFSRKLIPFGQLERSFAERVLVAGEAAGQVKSTTHGGVYYGLIGARCAVETLDEALKKDSFGVSVLSRYEVRWRKILEKEIDRGFLLRKFFSALNDRQIERLFELSGGDGILSALREKARFDWHGAIISFLVEHPLLKRYFTKISLRDPTY
jgi:digeranylgeranylglycerophospholipid reductase